MANNRNDPALETDQEFDDDFFTDLDNFDSQLDGFDIELIDDDGENRKPIDTSKLVTAALKSAGDAASGGVAAGIATRIKNAMPAAEELTNTVSDVLTQVETLGNDTITKVRPLLNQTKILGKQIFAQTKPFMPDTLHDYLSKKLESLLPTTTTESEKYTAPSKSKIREDETANTLAEIFKLQQAADERDKQNEFVENVLQNQITQNRHDQLAALVGDIRNQQFFQTTFTRSTYMAYLRKDLELKYRHLYLAEDTLEVLRVMSNIQEKKLDEIRHNTALPDAQKITIMEVAKQKILSKASDKFLGGFGKAVNNYFGDMFKNLKKEFVDPVISGIGDANDMADQILFGLSQANQMGMTSVSESAKTASGWLGRGIGGFIGNHVAKKFLNKLTPEARQMVDDYLSMGKTGAVLLMDEIKEKGVDLPGLEQGGIVQDMLSRILPNIDKTGGSLENNLYENANEPGKITNKFVATVEEIIPGYLSMQVQYLERLVEFAKSGRSETEIANAESIERKFYNFKSGTFSTQSELEQQIDEDMFGSRRERAARLKSAANGVRKYINFESGETRLDKETFDKAEKEIGIWIMNLAMRKRRPDAAMTLDALQQVADTGEFPNSDIEASFRGIKNPSMLASILISILYRKDGSTNWEAFAGAKRTIMDLMVRVVDQNRKGTLKNFELYGSEPMKKFMKASDDGSKFSVRDEVYHSQLDDVTQNELNENFTEEFDEYGLRKEKDSVYEVIGKKLKSGYENFKVSDAGRQLAEKLDRGATSVAKKFGVEDQYQKLKNWVKEKWDSFCALARKWKLKLANIPKTIAAKASVRVYKWMMKSKYESINELASIMFTEEGVLRKKVDSQRLANLLVNVPGFYKALHWLYTKDSPLTYLIRMFLPITLQKLGQMDPAEVEEIRKDKHPEDKMVKLLGWVGFGKDKGDSSGAGAGGPEPDEPDDGGPGEGDLEGLDEEFEGESALDPDKVTEEVQNNLGKHQYKFGSETVGTVNKATTINKGEDLVGEAGIETIVPHNHSDAAKKSFNDAAKYHNPDAVIPTEDEEPWVYSDDEDDDEKPINPNAIRRHAKGGRVGEDADKKKNEEPDNDAVDRKKAASIVDELIHRIKDLDIRKKAESAYDSTKKNFEETKKAASDAKKSMGDKFEEWSRKFYEQKEGFQEHFRKKSEEEKEKEKRKKVAEELEKDIQDQMENGYRKAADSFFEGLGKKAKSFWNSNSNKKTKPGKEENTEENINENEESDFDNFENYAKKSSKYKAGDKSKQSFGEKFSKFANAGVQYATSAGHRFVRGTSKLIQIAEDQLLILKRILLQMMTGVAVGPAATKKEIDAALAQEIMGRQRRSIGDKVWAGIKWTGRRIKNVAYDAPMATVKWSTRTVRDAAMGTAINEAFAVYRKPLRGEQIDYENPLLTAEEFKAGVYADTDGKKRIKSVRDIKGPVYDKNGRPLITKDDIRVGLVDHNGRPIRTIGSKLGRAAHGAMAGVGNAGWGVAKAAGRFVERHQLLSSAVKTTGEVLSAPFSITKAIFQNWIDVCRKMPDGSIRVLAYAKDLKNGYLQFANGKKPKSSYSIDRPLFYTNDPANGENAGQIAINNEDLRAGLCDKKGKPLKRFANKLGRLTRAGMELSMNLTNAIFGGASSIVTFAFGIIKTGVREAFRKRNPFIDVFVPDENGKIDQTKPRMLGRKIQEGAYMYRDGKPVKSAYGIKHAVVEIATGNTVIEEDEVGRTVDYRGRRLSRFAGRSLVGKVASLGMNMLGHSAKILGKGMWNAGKKLVGGLWKGGKSLFKFATTGIFDSVADIFGYANNVFQEALSTIMRSKTINRDDLKSMVSDKLDVIIDLMKRNRSDAQAEEAEEDAIAAKQSKEEAAAKKKADAKARQEEEKKRKEEHKKNISGDKDGDGIREGSYRAKMKKKKEELMEHLGGYRRRVGAAKRLLGRKIANTAVGRAASAVTGAASSGFSKLAARFGAGAAAGAGTAAALGGTATAAGGTAAAAGAGTAAAAGAGTAAAGIGLGTVALAAGGALVVAGLAYGAYKLYQGYKSSGTAENRGSWFFDSDYDVQWRERRYKEYGIPLNEETEDALEDFEEDTADLIRDADGSVFNDYDEDDLYELGEDIGLFTEDDDKDTLKKKKEYLKVWYEKRFVPVLACYMSILKQYTGDDDLDDVDDIESDAAQQKAAKDWDRLISRNVTSEARKYVPTKEGYEAFLKGKQGYQPEDKEKDKKTEGEKTKESTIQKAEEKQAEQKLQEEKDKQAKKQSDAALKQKVKEKNQESLDKIQAQTDEVKKKAAETTATAAAAKGISDKTQQATNSDVVPRVDSGTESGTTAEPAKTSVMDKLGWGGPSRSSAPEVDLSGLESVKIPDGGTGDLGSYVRRFESGSRGPAAIGFDREGGTSYGTYQLASAKGTLDEFLEYAKQTSNDFGGRLYKAMKEAGRLNTGSRAGAGPEIWKQFAGIQSGEPLHALETGFIKKTHYTKAYNQIKDPKAKALIDKDRGLQEALWSTSIQHGPGSAAKGNGAAGIFNKTFKDGTTAADWLRAIYEKRGTQFGSSSAQVQTSVKNRFKQELPIVLGLSEAGGGAAADSAGLDGTTDTATGSSDFNSAGGSSVTTSGDFSTWGGGFSQSTGGSSLPAESQAVTEAKNINVGDIDTSSLKIENGVDFGNLHPYLKQRISAVGKEFEQRFGRKITITSGKRSMERQAELYRELGPGKAAKPSPYSPHISGVALDANSADMNKADEAGLLEQFGLWRPLKNGLGRTKPEAWHVELMGSRDPETKRITEETLKAINAAGVDPNTGSGDANEPAAQDTSSDGKDAESLQEQKQEVEKQAPTESSSSGSSTPSSSSTSSASTTSTPSSTPSSTSAASPVPTSASTSDSNTQTITSTPTEQPSTTAAATPAPTASDATASVTPSTPSASSTSPAVSTIPPSPTLSPVPNLDAVPFSSKTSPNIETNTPFSTNTVNGPEISSDAQLQEIKLTNQILNTINDTLKAILDKQTNAVPAQTIEEKPEDSKTTNNTGVVTAGIKEMTEAFSSALDKAFSPGAPAYKLLSDLSESSSRLSSDVRSFHASEPIHIRDSIDVAKSNLKKRGLLGVANSVISSLTN